MLERFSHPDTHIATATKHKMCHAHPCNSTHGTNPQMYTMPGHKELTQQRQCLHSCHSRSSQHHSLSP